MIACWYQIYSVSISVFFILSYCMLKINEDFVCSWCNQAIPKAEKTCRNHCPHCFVSLHVDWKIPWDRASDCHWLMFPTSYIYKSSQTKILFTCSLCQKTHWNKQASDDQIILLDDIIHKHRSKYL